MICPRCSVAEISTETNECVLCGFSPSDGVVVHEPIADEVQETVQKELAGKFHLRVLLERRQSSIRYLAQDLEADCLVTLQLLPHQGPLNAEIIQQFELAASAARMLRHPHVIPLRNSGLSRSLLWYTMDAIKGRSLAATLRESGPWDVNACLELLEQLASGLEYIHRQGLIHGAVTPATIHIDSEGWARLSDVAVLNSIARAGREDSGWRALLSARYVAPEQLSRRSPGPQADQFALACVARDCLLGGILGSGDIGGDEDSDPTEGGRSAQKQFESLPPEITTAIDRAVSPDPQARFATVLDFVAVLDGGGPGASSPLLLASRPSEASSKVFMLPEPQPRVFPTKVVLLLIALVAGGVALMLLLRAPVPQDWVTAQRSPIIGTRPVPAGQVGADTVLSDVARPESLPVVPPAAAAVAQAVGAQQPTPAVRTRSRPAVRARPGMLFVSSRPWGVLYIDDRRIGNTPKVNLSIAPGTHVLRIERDGFAAFERVIEIRSGAELRITGIELEPIRP